MRNTKQYLNLIDQNQKRLKYSSFGYLNLFRVSILVFFCILALQRVACSMGEIPSTSEIIVPVLEYSGQIGMPGAGDGQFYSPHDVKASIVGNSETGLG